MTTSINNRIRCQSLPPLHHPEILTPPVWWCLGTSRHRQDGSKTWQATRQKIPPISSTKDLMPRSHQWQSHLDSKQHKQRLLESRPTASARHWIRQLAAPSEARFKFRQRPPWISWNESRWSFKTSSRCRLTFRPSFRTSPIHIAAVTKVAKQAPLWAQSRTSKR